MGTFDFKSYFDSLNGTGGTGSYGTYTTPAGESVSLNEDAYKATMGTNHGGTLSQKPADATGWSDALNMGLQGAQALSGLASAYLGYKNYKLAKEKFGAEKGAMNRNLINQAQLANEDMRNASNVGLALAGSSMTPEQKDIQRKATEAKFLSTKPVA